MISVLAMFGLSFLYSNFIVFPIQEKQSKVIVTNNTHNVANVRCTKF